MLIHLQKLQSPEKIVVLILISGIQIQSLLKTITIFTKLQATVKIFSSFF